MDARLPKLYALAVAGATVAYFLAPAGSDAQAAVYEAVSVGAALAVFAGIRHYRPARARHWWLFAGALSLWALGDTYWDFYRFVLHAQAPYPGPADAAYVAGYPVFLAGVFTLTRGWGRPRLGDVLDASIVLVGGATLTTLVLLEPMLSGSLRLTTAVTAATPVGDLLLLVGLTQLLFRRRARNLALRSIGIALLLTLVADAIYSYMNSKGSYTTGNPIDAGWLLGYGLWGVAALHPSMASMQAPSDERAGRLGGWRITVLVAALVAPPAALVAEALLRSGVDAIALGLVAILMTLLVGARVALLQRERLQVDAALAASERSYRELFLEADDARAALAEHNERLLEVDALKDDLIALVSHELRTPLTSIIGYLELVLDDEAELSDEQRSFLSVVDRNANRLLQLVSDLLFVAQAQAGRLMLERDIVDVGAVCRDAVAAAMPRALDHDIDLTLSHCDDVEIVGDRGRLSQVVDNLVSNAIKFTPPGGSVDVRLAADDEVARVEVADTGMGISAEDQQQLFTRFFRSEAAMAKAIDGTGLGLSIVKTIIDGHGGDIAVESKEGEGTTFRLTLPRVPAVAAWSSTVEEEAA